jgi:hypothetical protein
MGKLMNLVGADKLQITVDASISNENYIGATDQNGAPLVLSKKNLRNAIEAGMIEDGDSDTFEVSADDTFTNTDGVLVLNYSGGSNQGPTDLKSALMTKK